MQQYPNDPDGDVLKRLSESGVDMTKPIPIEFSIIAPDEKQGNKVERFLNKKKYATELYRDEVSLEWVIVATISLLPEYELLLRHQCELSSILVEYECQLDGWGSFGDIEAGS